MFMPVVPAILTRKKDIAVIHSFHSFILLDTGKKRQLHHIFTSYCTAQSNPVRDAKDHGAKTANNVY